MYTHTGCSIRAPGPRQKIPHMLRAREKRRESDTSTEAGRIPTTRWHASLILCAASSAAFCAVPYWLLRSFPGFLSRAIGVAVINRLEARHHRARSRATFADISTRRTINGGSVPLASVRFRCSSERSFSHFATRRNSSSRSLAESSRGRTIAMPMIAPSACSCPTNGNATNAT